MDMVYAWPIDTSEVGAFLASHITNFLQQEK
jgi:hypothetical protein